MLEDLFLSRRWIERFREAPLGPYIEEFSDDLAGLGFALPGIRRAVSAVNRFGRWLRKQHLRLEDVSEETISQFRGRRWSSSCRHGEASLCRLLQRLREKGVAPAPVIQIKRTPLDRIEEGFGNYLRRERGLSSVTIQGYAMVVRRFISHRFGTGPIDLSVLSASDIRAFVSGQAHFVKVIQPTLTGLRSFLQFLYLHEDISTQLADHLPRPAARPQDPPDKWLKPDEIDCVLNRCDRQSATGRRDFAILLLLARLGLRAGEIASLKLEDIRWETGEIAVCGKAQQRKRFPLPKDVGEALASYLKSGRQPCVSRHVFLRVKAPRREFAGSSTIYGIVSSALARAGLSPPCRGPHLFRHSLATTMLHNGASLSEIGQILHHRDPNTTAIYAKVDIAGLRTVALPWPGEK